MENVVSFCPLSQVENAASQGPIGPVLEEPHLPTTDSGNAACSIANPACWILLVSVSSKSWSLLPSFISQAAAHGDETAGTAAPRHEPASCEVQNWC